MPVSRPRRTLSTSIAVGLRKPKTTVSTGTLIRSMYQTNSGTTPTTALSYEFHFGISTFTHDGAGVLYTEIPRPLNLPLVDATSQKLERCSFEFLIAIPFDSLGSSVDSHITLLQDFATDARPVNFLNVHSALALKTWNIDSMSFQVTRVNESGQATAVTCNLSLVEHIARTNERFYGLPKFTYTIPKGTGLAGTIGVGSGVISVTGNVTHIEGFIGGYVTVTTAANHGLKSGDKVKINMTPDLPKVNPNIQGLRNVNDVYDISVLTATKFQYRYASATLTQIYAVLSPKAITYSTTTSDVTSPFVAGIEDKSTYVPYVAPPNTGSTNITLTIDGGPALTALEESAKQYLYKLKATNSTRYNSYIGKSDSERFKKAVTYLVKVSKAGTNLGTITLNDVIDNTMG